MQTAEKRNKNHYQQDRVAGVDEALTQRQEAGLKMLRCSLGVSSMDGIRNESIAVAVWACAKEGRWKYWTKDDEYGATGQGKEKTRVSWM